MPTSYTSLLGLALPVQGELAGTWGDEVNNYITSYLDAAIAGTQTISGSQTAVTLSQTTGTTLAQAGSGAVGSSQYQIINCTGNPASLLTITAPAASKVYLVLNNTSTSQSVKIVGSGPTAGITIASAQCALVAWNGSDFEVVASTDVSILSGVLPVSKGGTGATTLTGLVKGNGTSAFSPAVAGTDYLDPSSIGVTVQAYDADLTTWAGKTAPTGAVVGTTDTQTLTNKTLTTPIISSISNTGTLTLPTSTDTLVGRATTDTLTNKTLTNPSLDNSDLTAIKTATFNGQNTIATTTGAITIDWTTAQNQLQTEPTGTITYTFTAPPGPCHLQLIISSDGTSTAQTINWPGTVIQYGATWAGANNKKSVINFWYDGTNYHMIGSNQV